MDNTNNTGNEYVDPPSYQADIESMGEIQVPYQQVPFTGGPDGPDGPDGPEIDSSNLSQILLVHK